MTLELRVERLEEFVERIERQIHDGFTGMNKRFDSVVYLLEKQDRRLDRLTDIASATALDVRQLRADVENLKFSAEMLRADLYDVVQRAMKKPGE